MYGHWGTGFMWMGWIFWLAILIIAAWLIYRIVTDGRLRRGEGSSFETPLDIVKKRYARGEITKEQFEQMKKDLQ